MSDNAPAPQTKTVYVRFARVVYCNAQIQVPADATFPEMEKAALDADWNGDLNITAEPVKPDIVQVLNITDYDVVWVVSKEPIAGE